jgi:hypothetical protein
MDIESTIRWFEEIAAVEISPMPNTSVRQWGIVQPLYSVGKTTKWITDAQSALESVFPIGHSIMKRWYAVLDIKTDFGFSSSAIISSARAVFSSALDLMKTGHLTSLVTSIRTDTVTEVLDQAEVLLGKKYLAAAAVLAGGALETHLHYLCDLNEIKWQGDGSIGAYNSAIATERKNGKEIYSSAYGKLITAWADFRNAAAHTPTKFDANQDDIRSMVNGIRDVIARTT